MRFVSEWRKDESTASSTIDATVARTPRESTHLMCDEAAGVSTIRIRWEQAVHGNGASTNRTKRQTHQTSFVLEHWVVLGYFRLECSRHVFPNFPTCDLLKHVRLFPSR